MRRIDQLRLAKLRARKLGPIPTGDPTGITVHDPEGSGESVFISFPEIEETCQMIMDPTNTNMVESQLGKMHYSRDPTYNMRKPK